MSTGGAGGRGSRMIRTGNGTGWGGGGSGSGMEERMVTKPVFMIVIQAVGWVVGIYWLIVDKTRNAKKQVTRLADSERRTKETLGEHTRYLRRIGAAAQRCHCSRAVVCRQSYKDKTVWRRAAEQGQGSHSSVAGSDITHFHVQATAVASQRAQLVPAKVEHHGWRAGVDS